MARRPRNYAAEYAARKARLAAEGRTLYRQRNAEARRRGYDSLADQRARRKAGDLTHADHAAQAKRAGGKYVDNLGGGRWTFATPTRREGLSTLDRSRLNATLDRAWRARANLTITGTWRDPKSGRTGTAQAGGDYGVRARRIHTPGADGLASIEGELRAAAGSALPPGAIITSLNIFAFPTEQGRSAA